MIKSRRYYFVWCAAATFLLVGSLTFAFKPRIHAAITNVGLAGVVTGPKTLNALVVNNMKTDAPPHFFLAKNHFDEESFLAGSQLMADRLNGAVTNLGLCRKPEALFQIGLTIHGAQDFYAHSNWVENHIVDGTVTPAKCCYLF